MSGPDGAPSADDAADELYALHPQDFTARRDELAGSAKASGDRAAAKQIAALRKPSTSAWLGNVLVRARADDVTSLLDLGAALRQAQAGLRGEDLRALSKQRRQAVNALVREARRIAADLGRPVTEEVGRQLEQTLEAALADDDVARLLESGRLVSALTPSGDFGAGAPQLRVVHDEDPKPAGRRPVADTGERRAAAGEARAELARRRIAEADVAAQAARTDLATKATDHERIVADLASREAEAADVQARIADLTERLREIHRQLAVLRRDQQQARSAVTAAERAARTADSRAASARAELDTLGGPASRLSDN